jgi:1-acyl-sn-glycerol-3-phosphate acyltransferase
MKFDKSKVYNTLEDDIMGLKNKYPSVCDQHMLEVDKQVELPVLDENYPYWDRSFCGRWKNFWIYIGIWTLVFFLAPIKYGLKICGRKNITKNKKYFKNGAVTVSNHCYKWDLLGVLQAVRFKKLYFPAWKDNLMGSNRNLIRNVGGIPIPEGSFRATGAFFKAFDDLHAHKKWIHVFPESCSWHYYPYIRSFKRGAFDFAYRYDIPVIPMAFSFRKPKGLAGFLAGGKPLCTLNVGEPIFPDKNLSRKQCILDLRKKTFDAVVSLAGIENNPWPCEGD